MPVDDAPAGGTLDYAWRRGGQRPRTLREHVAFAAERALSAVLEIRRGPIEVGRLEVVRGEVVHAELPGSAGDGALRLLGRLGTVEILVRPGGTGSRVLVTHRIASAVEAPSAVRSLALAA